MVRRAGLLALASILVGCDEPTLPTELDEIRYTTVVIDEESLDPAPGEVLAIGAPFSYDVTVRYQRAAEDMADGDAQLSFYVEMWDSTASGWNWVGDAAWETATASGSSGTVSFSGTTTLPALAGQCETFDQVRLFAIIDPATNVAHRDGVVYDVSGGGTPPNAGTLALGAAVTNELSAAAPCESWTLTIGSAQTVEIGLSSSEFDSYLILQNASGVEIARNDDRASGNLNSLIVEDLAAGTYRVLVTSYGGGSGAYQLYADTPNTSCTAGAIVPPDTVAGSLGPSDCTFNDGSSFDLWTMTLTDSASVVIDLMTSAFDAYVILYDASGGLIAENDDRDGTTTDARIAIVLGPGTYQIAANSLGAGESGAYSLGVVATSTGPNVVPIATARLQSPNTEATVEGVITAGTGTFSAQTFYLQDASGGIAVFLGAGSTPGAFNAGDSVRVTGTVSAFNAEVQLGDTVTVTVLGTSTVPSPVEVRAAQLLANQFQGQLVVVREATVDSIGTVSGSGNYSVFVTDSAGSPLAVFVDVDAGIPVATFTVGSIYDITGIAARFNSTFQVKPRGPSDIVLVGDGGSAQCDTWTPVTIPSTTAGTLASTDCNPGDGYYYEGYRLTLGSTTNVTIDLTSSAFNAYLIVTDTTNSDPSITSNWLASNEDGGGGTNARLSLTMAAGTYVIWVSSSNVTETGAYQLVLSTPAGAAPVPISTARQQTAGTPVTVEGVVTAGNDVYSSDTFYLQDTSAGIAVVLGAGSTSGSFTEGDSVRVTGTVAVVNQEVRIGGTVTVTELGTAAVRTPVTKTVAGLNAGQDQGELVFVEDLTVDSLGTPGTGGSFSVWVSDPTSTDFTILVDGGTGIADTSFTVGATYDIVGIASRVNATFLVKPRSNADIVRISSPSPCQTWAPVAVPSTTAGTLEATDCAPGDGYYYEGYRLTVTASSTITIDLTSSAFDAYLVLTDTVNSDPSATANWLASDNDSAGGTNARLSGTISPGTYIVWVTSNFTGQTGAYQLQIQ